MATPIRSIVCLDSWIAVDSILWCCVKLFQNDFLDVKYFSTELRPRDTLINQSDVPKKNASTRCAMLKLFWVYSLLSQHKRLSLSCSTHESPDMQETKVECKLKIDLTAIFKNLVTVDTEMDHCTLFTCQTSIEVAMEATSEEDANEMTVIPIAKSW